MNRKHIAGLILCLAFSFSLTSIKGQSVIEEPGVSYMMKRFLEINRDRTEFMGYRIQIMFSSDRQRMDKALTRFRINFPDKKVEWTYSRPYYKVYTGAYMTKTDVQMALLRFRKQFPGAIEYQDEIFISEFLD